MRLRRQACCARYGPACRTRSGTCKPAPAFYPAVTVAVLCIVFGAIFLVQFLKSKSGKAGETLAGDVAPKPAGRPLAKKARKAPIHSCNVLQVTPDARHLWQFSSRGRGFVLSREQRSVAGRSASGQVRRQGLDERSGSARSTSPGCRPNRSSCGWRSSPSVTSRKPSRWWSCSWRSFRPCPSRKSPGASGSCRTRRAICRR